MTALARCLYHVPFWNYSPTSSH